jgi:hypothetical protein
MGSNITRENLSGLPEEEALALSKDPYYQPKTRDWAYESEHSSGWYDTGRVGNTATLHWQYSADMEGMEKRDFQKRQTRLFSKFSTRFGSQIFWFNRRSSEKCGRGGAWG